MTRAAKTQQDYVEQVLNGIEVNEQGCWIWTGSIASHGYGVLGPHGVHRLMYEHFVGPRTKGLSLDHLCHGWDTDCHGGDTACLHRRCCNPEHLEQVTPRINCLRGRSPAADRAAQSHCVNGHEFTPENTYRRNAHARMCIRCRTEKQASAIETRHADMLAGRISPEHGTEATYRAFACRCELCRTAHLNVARERHWARDPDWNPIRQRPFVHGTRNCFMRGKCRCEPCREANSAYYRARRNAAPHPVT